MTSPSSRTLSTRAKPKSSSPKVDGEPLELNSVNEGEGEPLESNSVDEGEAEVVIVVEAKMMSTGQDLFARGARLLAPL